jgi:tetrahydromethanopterin S-methyltransferase subunit C
MKPWLTAALIASIAGCAAAPPGPNVNANPDANAAYPVVTQDANGVPVEVVPRRVPRVGLGIGLGSWGSGVGIGLGF